MAETDLLIDLEPATTAPPIVVETETPEQSDAVADLGEQLKAIEAREKTARDQAEAQLRDRDAEIAKLRDSEAQARTATVDSQIDAVSNAELAAKAEAEAAARDYASAMESADYIKSASAQRAMARAEAKLLQIGQAKADLMEVKKAPPQTAHTEQPKPATNQRETVLRGYTQATQQWLVDHPDVLDSMMGVGDRALASGAAWAHAQATKKGIKPDTPEYFSYVETQLGYRKEEPAVAEVEKVVTQQPQQRRAIQSAPVTRESNGNGTVSNNRVRLTPGEQEAATNGTLVWDKYDTDVMAGKAKAGYPIGIQEMAKRKQLMSANGDYTRRNENES